MYNFDVVNFTRSESFDKFIEFKVIFYGRFLEKLPTEFILSLKIFYVVTGKRINVKASCALY